MNRFLTVISIVAVLGACNPSGTGIGEEDGLSAFSADSLGKHIAVLSGDDFLGRKPFTEGETKTIQYLKQQFTAAGLEPGNGNSYFQEVPMVNITTHAAPDMQVRSGKGNFILKGPTNT